MPVRYSLIALLAFASAGFAQRCPDACETQITALDDRIKKLEQAQYLPYAVTRNAKAEFQDFTVDVVVLKAR
jgi:hypothetical protein